ncbi:hypothetical protein JTE90_005754 [Oedothorax gibbosus]|uniref:RING-type domain-containing protein n=1 Tax=Oedothorax gibbosus TaxID=931172 RepID=A0AAV6UR96_9ARAC|nr:hypothetical protein JTE90_005754 [Oedothorax gibbosus]
MSAEKVFAFIFVGVFAAAAAVYVWLNKDDNKPHRNNRPPSNNSNETGDVTPPKYFETGSNCIVCCENPSTVKFVPCLHSCLCSNCYRTYLKYDRKCPLCRIEIDHVITSA